MSVQTTYENLEERIFARYPEPVPTSNAVSAGGNHSPLPAISAI